jgi:hypothetical protein
MNIDFKYIFLAHTLVYLKEYTLSNTFLIGKMHALPVESFSIERASWFYAHVNFPYSDL